MFIDPRQAIEREWIVGVDNPDDQVQPNAIDFTLDKLSEIVTSTARVGRISKTMRPLYEIKPHTEVNEQFKSPLWALMGQQVYDGMSHMYVKIPDGVAAILFTRSTFTRNGVFIVSGLYDSGFEGHIGFTIYTMGGPIEIEQGTRIGQIAFVEASSAKQYAGGWNHEIGTHYA